MGRIPSSTFRQSVSPDSGSTAMSRCSFVSPSPRRAACSLPESTKATSLPSDKRNSSTPVVCFSVRTTSPVAPFSTLTGAPSSNGT